MSSLIPGCEVAVTKYGFSRYMGRLLHPSVTGPLIESQVEKALKGAVVKPHQWAEPTMIRMEFNRSEEADMGAKVSGVRRIDTYTLEISGSSYEEAHRTVWVLVALSFQGIASQP
jgi:D-amino peptidase